MYFTVDDFRSGHDHDTPAKRFVYNQLAQTNGGWDCAMRSYEVNSGKVSAKGLTKIIRRCLDPQSGRIDAEARYNGDPEGPINYLVHMLAPQWSRKFPEIYALHTGKTIYGQHLEHQLGFEHLNKSLNTKSTPIKRKDWKKEISKTKLLPIAVEVNKLLEPLSEEERAYVLGV